MDRGRRERANCFLDFRGCRARSAILAAPAPAFRGAAADILVEVADRANQCDQADGGYNRLGSDCPSARRSKAGSGGLRTADRRRHFCVGLLEANEAIVYSSDPHVLEAFMT